MAGILNAGPVDRVADDGRIHAVDGDAVVTRRLHIVAYKAVQVALEVNAGAAGATPASIETRIKERVMEDVLLRTACVDAIAFYSLKGVLHDPVVHVAVFV